MSRIVLLLITFWAATVGLIGGVAPDLLAARPENATDVVEKDVRGLTRVRIATSGVLSGGEAEGWIDVEGEVAEIMLAFSKPATALQIADYYTRELERRHATVLFKCEGRNCGLRGFSHWPGSYASYVASNTKSQV